MDIQQLKMIADKLNIGYGKAISAERLEIKIKNYCDDNKLDMNTVLTDEELNELDKVDNQVANARLDTILSSKAEKEETERLHDAMKLVRVRITCNNSNKSAYTGEIFCVRNDTLQPVKKFVPFGVITHIPQILYNMLKEKECQKFTQKRVNGHTITETSMIPEYNIEVLPPITPEELEAIKKKQLAEGFNGE